MDEQKQIARIEKDVYVSLKDHLDAILREQNKSLELQIKTGDDWMARHIREHVEQIKAIIASDSQRVKQAYESSQLAITKAEEATEKRLDLLNEFRGQQSDESRKYALREVVDDRLSKVENQISRLYGGILVIGVIGVANLVKLWFVGL